MLKIAVIGLGPIGLNCAKAVLQDRNLALTGIVDLDPGKVGRTLGELTGEEADHARVVRTLDEVPASDVAILTTTSRFDQAAETLRVCMARKLHVVSSCEEMAYPAYLHPDLAGQIDADAKKAGVSLLGTGVNPGFVMDFLPVVLSSMVMKVSSVKAIRRVDAATRRKPLQAKVGATMTVEQFNQLAREGQIGHRGIGESIALIAAGLGRVAKREQVTITLEPVIADREYPSLLGPVKPGCVSGMRNTAKWSGDGLSVELDLTMAIGTPDPHDLVELGGPVPLKLKMEGGTPGDTATVSSLVNYARVLPNANPGLHTMLDIQVGGASCR